MKNRTKTLYLLTVSFLSVAVIVLSGVLVNRTKTNEPFEAEMLSPAHEAALHIDSVLKKVWKGGMNETGDTNFMEPYLVLFDLFSKNEDENVVKYMASDLIPDMLYADGHYNPDIQKDEIARLLVGRIFEFNDYIARHDILAQTKAVDFPVNPNVRSGQTFYNIAMGYLPVMDNNWLLAPEYFSQDTLVRISLAGDEGSIAIYARPTVGLIPPGEDSVTVTYSVSVRKWKYPDSIIDTVTNSYTIYR